MKYTGSMKFFSTLMGVNVEERRFFIENNAKYVANLFIILSLKFIVIGLLFIFYQIASIIKAKCYLSRYLYPISLNFSGISQKSCVNGIDCSMNCITRTD
jgi:hypothetical protein